MKAYNVAIIEDDKVIRNGYSFLIAKISPHKITGTYSSLEEAMKDLPFIPADIILLDIGLPGLSGIEAIPLIKKVRPNAAIIMITVMEHEDQILEALRNGAAGYLTKKASPKQIVSAIEEVMEGGGPMSANIASIVIRSFQKNEHSPLTEKETEILQAIAAGKSRIKIQNEMLIKHETVRSHLKNIYFKLDVHSKEEAIKIARQKKYI